MSPAAAPDFQSPFTVKTSSSSSANPNFLNPFSCTNDRPQEQSHGTTNSNSSSGLHDVNEFGFGIGSGVGDGNGFASYNGSMVGSGRRPRLMKMRKHAGRSRTSTTGTETGLGFNPFQSTGENSGSIHNFRFNSSFSNNGVSDEATVWNESCFVKNENVGFVFGANLSNVGADLNLEKRDTSECTEKSGLGDDLCLNSNLKKEEFCGTLKKSASNQQFGVNQNDVGSSSNFKKSEYNGIVSDSGLGFVFGASWCNSALNLNPQGSDSIENNGKTVSDNQGKKKAESKMESQKAKASEARFDGNGGFGWSEDYGEGVFVFVGGKKKSSCSDDCGTLNSPNEAKLDSKSFGNDNNIGRNENDNLDFDVNNKSNIASETSSTNNIGSTSITDSSSMLPDEMLKLNINEHDNDYSTYKKYDSNKNPCSNADTTFVFSSSLKPSSSFDESSGPTDENISGPSAAVDRMAGDSFGNGNNDTNYQPLRNQAGLPKSSKVRAGMQTNLAAEQASSSSDSFKSQQNDHGSETPSMVGVQKDESSPTNTQHGLGASFTEFVTPNWDPSCFKASLYPELNKKLEHSVKSKSIKEKRSKKTRGKSKQPSLRQGLKQVHMPKQSSSQESPSTPDCYSPMDFSPYVETTVNDQPSLETCVTSKEPFYPDNGFAPFASHSSVTNDPKDESFATAEKNDVEIASKNFRESNKESPWKEFVFGSETAYQEQLHSGRGNAVPSAEHADDVNTENRESVKYCFASGADDRKYFAFSSLSSADGDLTSRKCKSRKKSKKKVGNNSFVISSCPNDKVSFSNQATTSLCNTVGGQEESKHNNKVRSKYEVAEQVKQGSVSSTAAFEETCEMWRLRGNQAYKNSNLTKAEDFYTQGINSVPLSETAGCCIKPLVLCYSNRAATRITLGRMREALEDCMMAATVDPNFHKVYLRAANCHLVLGEIENALQYYNKLLNSGVDVCLDRRITIEAADGLQKAQKVAECINCSAKLLEQKTSEAASSALEIIIEALSISSCSEKLLEMKAEALYMLRKYEEAIQLCEQTRCVAEKNFASVVTDNCSVNMKASGSVNYSLARLWRWRFISKSYFCMGKLEVALDILQKLEEVGSIREKYGSEILESAIALAATIRELLRHKSAGNEAVKSGRYTEAVEHYTVALSSNVESRPFVAICFCNRAAALQALGQIADAIEDCSLAMALDENYTKAVSRRASLHEMIRDYAQAASDLQRLISILENRSAEKIKQSGSPGRSTGSKDIRQARRHTSLMEEEAKKGYPLDFYLILGVKASDTAADIKKAYRKAALKHHPDKAGQFLARTDCGDEGRLWKEIAHEVHKDADRLFKMIGEAYAVLSDTTKRSEYDLEEEIRKAPKESQRSSHYRRSSDDYNYSFRRSANNWKTYGNSYSQW